MYLNSQFKRTVVDGEPRVSESYRVVGNHGLFKSHRMQTESMQGWNMVIVSG